MTKQEEQFLGLDRESGRTRELRFQQVAVGQNFISRVGTNREAFYSQKTSATHARYCTQSGILYGDSHLVLAHTIVEVENT